MRHRISLARPLENGPQIASWEHGNVRAFFRSEALCYK